ncbi:MAG: LamG domain-containing protein, partial [Candidatus Desantisbacteria bacterium]
MSFDGIDNYVSVPDRDMLTPGSSVTVEAWVYPTSDTGQDYKRIVCKSTNSDNGEYTLWMYTTSRGVIWYVNDWPSGYIVSSGIPLNQWTHVVGVFDGSLGSNRLKIYINGSLNNQGNTTHTAITNTSSDLYIGNWGGAGRPFAGKIDEVRVYNRTLTPAEVNSHYSSGLNYVQLSTKPTDSNLVSYWNLDEGNGSYAYDAAGNGNIGTLTSGPTWVAGKYGKALSFNGTSDYVSVASPAGIPSANNNYTVSAWIKPNTMGTKGIIGWGTWATSNACNAFRLDSTNQLINYWWGNDLTVTCGDLTGAWHHVVALFDGTTRKIYVDGVLKGSDTPTGHNAVLSNFRIGCTNSTEYFDGLIDDVRIYNSGLTARQVYDLYSSG